MQCRAVRLEKQGLRRRHHYRRVRICRRIILINRFCRREAAGRSRLESKLTTVAVGRRRRRRDRTVELMLSST